VDGDFLMDINAFILTIGIIVQSIIALIALITVAIIYKLNQRIIFNEVVKQERELRIQLNKYRKEIHKKKNHDKDFEESALDHDTLLFNYYEYLAICLYKNMINEIETKLYFKQRLIYVKERFDSSLMFKKDYVKKEEYGVLNWLFKKWNI